MSKTLGPYQLGRIHKASVLEGLKRLPAGSVQCIVTSPPYWMLRDYEEPEQWGLEPTFDEYLEHMIKFGQLAMKALRDNGTMWLNMGDSYFSSGGHTSGDCVDRRSAYRIGRRPMKNYRAFRVNASARGQFKFKEKDLVGQPWRVAFALQAEGWYLRSDIIWHKTNPMPESAKDRPTKAHEYLFLLSKKRRYYYDHEAVKEDASTTRPELLEFGERKDVGFPGPSNDRRRRKEGERAFTRRRLTSPEKRQGRIKMPSGRETGKDRDHRDLGGRYKHTYDPSKPMPIAGKRNKRSVWTVPTQPYPGAHFATFPFKLIEPCILAGCPEGGVVLDPFAGSGTTGVVSERLGRQFVGFDLAGGDKNLGKHTANERIAEARRGRAVDRAVIDAIAKRWGKR